jgi:hypothetical protein
MQKCLTAASANPKMKHDLMLTIANNTPTFVKDPFANYVV